MALLELCEAPGQGEHMRVGVRNQYGDICLNIETENSQEYMNVVSCLDGRDMRDDLLEADGPLEGYNAIFTTDSPLRPAGLSGGAGRACSARSNR